MYSLYKVTPTERIRAMATFTLLKRDSRGKLGPEMDRLNAARKKGGSGAYHFFAIYDQFDGFVSATQ